MTDRGCGRGCLVVVVSRGDVGRGLWLIARGHGTWVVGRGRGRGHGSWVVGRGSLVVVAKAHDHDHEHDPRPTSHDHEPRPATRDPRRTTDDRRPDLVDDGQPTPTTHGLWVVGHGSWVVGCGRGRSCLVMVVGPGTWTVVIGGRRSLIVYELVGRRSSVVGRESWVNPLAATAAQARPSPGPSTAVSEHPWSMKTRGGSQMRISAKGWRSARKFCARPL